MKWKILFLFLLLCVVPLAYADYIYESVPFTLYLNDGSGLGVQAQDNSTIMMAITNGTLNSTTTTLYNVPSVYGFLRFNSSSSNNITVYFTGLDVSVNGLQVENETETTFPANSRNQIYWVVAFEPFLPVMFLFGMVGLGSMFGGVLYPIILIKKKEYVLALKMFTVFFFLGLGLFMAWVFM